MRYVHKELFILEEHGIIYICIARASGWADTKRQVDDLLKTLF